jgi:hypothetical protein
MHRMGKYHKRLYCTFTSKDQERSKKLPRLKFFQKKYSSEEDIMTFSVFDRPFRNSKVFLHFLFVQ